MCAPLPVCRNKVREMTQARAYSKASAIARPSLHLRLTRAAQAAVALLLLALATPGFAQTLFTAAVTFDRQPADYSARDTVTATVTATGDTDNVSNIGFTATLPAGVTFVSPPDSPQCNGVVTHTANTFTLTGGSFPVDTDCRVTVQISAAPATTTAYTLATGTFSFNDQAGVPRTHGGVSGDFTVEGGQPPGFGDSIPGDGQVGAGYFYGIDVTGTEPITIGVSGLPPGLFYESDGNEITGTPTKVGTYLVTITARNGFAPDASATYTIKILPADLSASKTFMPSTILSGGTTQMLITLKTTRNVNLISFDDPFPQGLHTIATGTSSQCGGTVTVGVDDVRFFGNINAAGSCTINVPVSATVNSARTIVNTTSPIDYNDGSTIAGVSGQLVVTIGVPPTITSGAPPAGTVGDSYHFPISAIGTPQIDFAVNGLPPGLAFDATTRSIDGIPTTPGTYAGRIIASNAFSPVAIQDFTIVIHNRPLAIVTNTLPPIDGGQQVNVPIVAQGGVPPYTFTLLSGQLPPGLSFNPLGILTGVPTAPGVYTFIAQVVDAAGTKATHAYTITIAKGTPVFAFTVAPDPAVIGQPVVATATLTGGGAAASGAVQVWVAHTGERCPVVAGDAPVAAKTVTAALNAGAQVQFSFSDLGIDHYQVCATYAGDVRYNAVNAGPFDLFVIKGALLPAPSVAIAAPDEVKASQMLTAQVAVKAGAQSAISPSGSVLLRANGVTVGTLALTGGTATFTTQAPAVPGTLMTLSASYLGDGAFPPAVSATALVTVTKADPSAAAPIPALSSGALGLLAALLGGAGALGAALRRRTQR